MSEAEQPKTVDELLTEVEEKVAEMPPHERRPPNDWPLDNFLYDRLADGYWDVRANLFLKSERAVNASCHKRHWEATIDSKGEEKLVPPAVTLSDSTAGRVVAGSVWLPGEPPVLRDVTLAGSGRIMPCDDSLLFNRYRDPVHPATPEGASAERWLAHLKWLYPEEAEREHFLDWAAHVLQHPEEKVNHGVVLAGEQGVGKDTLLEPLRLAVGHNTRAITPDDLMDKNNPYVQSVLLVVDELRVTDTDWAAANMYKKIKPLLAAPPNVIDLKEKYQPATAVANVCHVVFTTNEPEAFRVPETDRRLFIMTSPRRGLMVNEELGEDYFNDLWASLEDDGWLAVRDVLMARDLSQFNAKAPPPRSAGWHEVANVTAESRRTATDDLLDQLAEEPLWEEAALGDVLFAQDLLSYAGQLTPTSGFDDHEALQTELKGKRLQHLMRERGYVLTRPSGANRFKRGNFSTRVAYVRRTIDVAHRSRAVAAALQHRPLNFQSNVKRLKVVEEKF